MAERKAVNKYYPPEWDPSKGSINQYRGQHPLRERARKLDQGILVVRFEMPFNVWCEGCGRHIAKGVRFNAEKKQVGNYFSTKIWSFSMKCPTCSHPMEVQTDPKNTDFAVMSGARRKIEDWDDEEDGSGQMRLLSDEDRERLRNDPLFRLEHEKEDKARAEQSLPVLASLKAMTDWRADNHYELSQWLRKRLRKEKRKHQESVHPTLGLPLKEARPEDLSRAKAEMILNNNKNMKHRRRDHRRYQNKNNPKHALLQKVRQNHGKLPIEENSAINILLSDKQNQNTFKNNDKNDDNENDNNTSNKSIEDKDQKSSDSNIDLIKAMKISVRKHGKTRKHKKNKNQRKAESASSTNSNNNPLTSLVQYKDDA